MNMVVNVNNKIEDKIDIIDTWWWLSANDVVVLN
jgi:hypothetical protein